VRRAALGEQETGDTAGSVHTLNVRFQDVERRDLLLLPDLINRTEESFVYDIKIGGTGEASTCCGRGDLLGSAPQLPGEQTEAGTAS
jgi:hypothetical protein